MTETIPTIDIAEIFSKDLNALNAIAKEIRYAYERFGFAVLKNHHISKEIIKNMFESSKMFHACPIEEKMKIKVNSFMRGFIPINTSTLKSSTLENIKKPNQSESFIMMNDLPKNDPDFIAKTELIGGQNQWPDLPKFKEHVCAYYKAILQLSKQLTYAVAIALGQEQHFLDELFDKPTIFLRLLCYPPRPANAPADLYGSAPHTDYGFMTLLAQDNIGGLQVKTVKDVWIDVPSDENTLVMNAGDMLHRLSGGRFLSTPHRVINESGNQRFSCAFFFDPNFHKSIVSLPHMSSQKFQPVIYGEYLLNKIKTNYKL